MALQVQADLADVGVTVTLREYQDRSQYLRHLRLAHRPGGAELFLLGWGASRPDAGLFLASLGCDAAANLTNYCDRRFDRRLARARAVVERRERTRRYAVLAGMLTGVDGAHPVAAFLNYYAA